MKHLPESNPTPTLTTLPLLLCGLALILSALLLACAAEEQTSRPTLDRDTAQTQERETGRATTAEPEATERAGRSVGSPGESRDQERR